MAAEAIASSDVVSGDMIFEPVLEEGVFRFDCSASDRQAAYPSLSFVNGKARDTPISTHMRPLYTPTYQCVPFPAGTSLYGTGEVSGQLERTGKRIFTWNTISGGYGTGTTSLYQSHPWVLAVLPNGEALGVLADTTRRYPEDLTLRKLENSFLLGPVLVCASTLPDQRSDKLQHALPKGIWQSFDFEDSLPVSVLGHLSVSIKHVGESKPSDDLTLLVALDENEEGVYQFVESLALGRESRTLEIPGSVVSFCITCLFYLTGKAKGVLFEDDGDGYGFTEGQYLLTHYEAELQMSEVTIRVSKSEGLWKRPKRRLIVKILLGGGAVIDAWGMDGEDLQIAMPAEAEVSNLVSGSKEKYKICMESAKLISDTEKASEHMGVELSWTPIELKSGDWALKVVPWIGGRVISMAHLPSGTQWLHSRVEVNGYEEYCGTEYGSAGCTEVQRSLQHGGEEESLMLESDIGGGMILQRKLTVPKDNPKIFKIDSKILARNVGAGSGGFSRLVCLRVHPMFTLLHPTESFISFTSIDGSKQEIWPESGEEFYEGNLLPNGEWMLVDKCQGLALVNRFNIKEVFKCFIHWGRGTVNLELWSEERPVSKQSPLAISHEYKVIKIP
ncbi:hypothetical protein WN944_007061 [Citrus x changshan-huyou]|uniref:Heteroglycan glucosidase 1 n=1 Tax=Citrus x changshan-huyou TaxID=2935761 RepID=A0AAP0MKB6_9ROSI